ncbi:cupin domain-containing protein [Holophaga foetida]|uniref:cupin domain-containing protein n=1 Tax=Holophaga foetida TaxID=35839 RepID=UPI0002472EE6|nr:cupin domain-containing protein [Holophaga foetida]
MSLMLSCQEVAELLSDYSEERLPASLRLRVRLHLSLCHGCAVLRSTLNVTPRVCREALTESFPSVPLEARAALARALADLGRPRSAKALAVDPPPVDLAGQEDAPFRFLSQARESLAQGHMPSEAPYLPQEVLALLPPPSQWPWRTHPTSRSVLLCEDRGVRLTLLQALPGYQQPLHTHLGSESILVLEGHLEDGDELFTRGRWAHHRNGTSHAPAALGSGCWCLIREEGTARTSGLFHRNRNPLAA